jgi:hypothetical protein
MGMFDDVAVPCPCCGWFNDFQTKGADEDCALREFTLENAPDDVLSCVNDHSPCVCLKCDTPYYVNIRERKAVMYTSGDIMELEYKPFFKLLSRYDIAKKGKV